MTALFRSERDRVKPTHHPGWDENRLTLATLEELEMFLQLATQELAQRKSDTQHRMERDFETLAARAGLSADEYRVLFS